MIGLSIWRRKHLGFSKEGIFYLSIPDVKSMKALASAIVQVPLYVNLAPSSLAVIVGTGRGVERSGAANDAGDPR